MISDGLREARAICEREFSFLVTDFGYRRVRARFDSGGFELRYRGPVIGVLVEWYPRDPFTVWLVRLENSEFPERYAAAGTDRHRYFHLGDLEIIKTGRRAIDDHELYNLPSERTAHTVAESLRQNGSALLRGDLADIPQLEQRIRDRIAAAKATRRVEP